jgi:hypothetical protein
MTQRKAIISDMMMIVDMIHPRFSSENWIRAPGTSAAGGKA